MVEARAKATSIQVTAEDLSDPAKVAQFEAAQAQLSAGLGRLLASVEAYPDLKSNQNFLTLQSQLEGTENRITVARKRYIESVADYNKTVLYFPSSIGASMRGKKERPTFTGNPQNEKAPEVKF